MHTEQTNRCRYFLFSAALVVLSSEFSDLYPHITLHNPASSAIEVMRYCADIDPQAHRLHFVLTAFRDLVVQHRARIGHTMDSSIRAQIAVIPQPIPLSNERNEPLNTQVMTSPPPLATGPAHHPAPATIFQDPHGVESSISSATTSHSAPHISPSEYSRDKEGPSNMSSPQSSWDPFLELALPIDKMSEANDPLIGDAEIEFESLWQWPSHEGPGLMPTGANLTPGGTTLLPGNAGGLKL